MNFITSHSLLRITFSHRLIKFGTMSLQGMTSVLLERLLVVLEL